MKIMILIAIGISLGILIIAYLLTHRTNYPIKGRIGEEGTQYECGIELFEEEIGKEEKERMYLKYYVIGIVFLIFDLEALLLYPAVLSLSSETMDQTIGYITLIVFLSLVIIGLLYEFKKDVL